MKKKFINVLIGATLFMSPVIFAQTEATSKSIKLGLLLDTSSSMDGLIDQAKSQLWKIINKMTSATYNGTSPNIMIALYEYGNSGLPQESGYIRKVTDLTSDLDILSRDLFSLKTNGGSEFCGQVIQTAFNDLDWSTSTNDLQMIFIAGNEPFNQGKVDFKPVCQKVKNNDITINTIFCGAYQEGVNTLWKKGAELGEGEYFNIDQNEVTVYIDNPYDKVIDSLSTQLNQTYVFYGKNGKRMHLNQYEQDRNAKSYGIANNSLRAISKSSWVYDNSSWDLIDAMNQKGFDFDKIDKKTLPDSLKTLTNEAIKKELEAKAAKRAFLQAKIKKLATKREEYIAKERVIQSSKGNLDNAILVTIEKQGRSKGFEFK
ncbi:MAG: hypothetical protein CMP61_07285 [Flavobacteriales bacterium]|nr:hypothetical protein [Flavobacteriales bacterium]|tara:strand:- start:18383 stop:19501 length:1119 start_codon:yes stop_codon:yes gene_type:complete